MNEKITTSSTSPSIKHTLRRGFSKTASVSEVRAPLGAPKGAPLGAPKGARKKFKDGEINHALKSQFHSYRILLYGIQLGAHGTIVDWTLLTEGYLRSTAANDYLKELMFVDHSTLSDKFFRESYKLRVKTATDEAESIMTQFKLALPESP